MMSLRNTHIKAAHYSHWNDISGWTCWVYLKFSSCQCDLLSTWQNFRCGTDEYSNKLMVYRSGIQCMDKKLIKYLYIFWGKDIIYYLWNKVARDWVASQGSPRAFVDKYTVDRGKIRIEAHRRDLKNVGLLTLCCPVMTVILAELQLYLALFTSVSMNPYEKKMKCKIIFGGFPRTNLAALSSSLPLEAITDM